MAVTCKERMCLNIVCECIRVALSLLAIPHHAFLYKFVEDVDT